MNTTYDKQVEQDDRTTARDNLPVFFGSRDEILHPIREQFNNAFDELNENFESGKIIATISDDDREFTIEDTGRGMPLMLISDKGKPYWEVYFRTLFAGGKYEKAVDKNTGGTNGCGNTCTNFCSLFFECTSYFDGEEWFISFKDGGILDKPLTKIGKTNKHGTKIHFKLDPTVFSLDTIINYNDVKEYVTKCLMSFKNIIVELHYKNNVEMLQHDNNYFIINSLCEDEFIIESKDFMSKNKKGKDVRNTFSGEFYYTNREEYQQTNLNGIWLKDGGTINDGFIKGVRKFVNEHLKSSGLLKKNEKLPTTDDISSTISFCLNVQSSDVEYSGQTKFLTKSKVYESEIYDYIQSVLEIIKIERKIEFDRMITQILITKRANEKAETSRQNIKKELEKGANTALTRPKKYTPCTSKDRTRTRFIIMEGDSAKEPMRKARDKEIMALYALKGKIINALKNNLDLVLQNEEVKDIFKILGCGMEYKGKAIKNIPKYDESKLNFDTICACCDMDDDGYHIRSLLLCLFYTLAPNIIKNGHFYILLTPLYEITQGKNKYYAYTESEKNDIVKTFNGKKYKAIRFKGLGGLSTEILSETAMSETNAKMIQVTWEDAEKCKEAMELCMSDEKAKERKDFIETHGKEYFDVNMLEV